MPHTEKDIANIDMIGRMIKAAGSKVGGYDPDQLARLAALHDTLETAISDAIFGQRSAGVTWRAIGEGLGVTKEAVIQRYGQRVRAHA